MNRAAFHNPRIPKAQNAACRFVPRLLKAMRKDAGMTRRDLGRNSQPPQSWVCNCQTANRRTDAAELALCSRACGINPRKAFHQLLAKLPPQRTRR